MNSRICLSRRQRAGDILGREETSWLNLNRQDWPMTVGMTTVTVLLGEEDTHVRGVEGYRFNRSGSGAVTLARIGV